MKERTILQLKDIVARTLKFKINKTDRIKQIILLRNLLIRRLTSFLISLTSFQTTMKEKSSQSTR